jgi:uracil-DNA glycosylase family 4
VRQPLSPAEELRSLTQDVRVYLAALRTWGVQEVPHSPPASAPLVAASAPVTPSARPGARKAPRPQTAPAPRAAPQSPPPPSSQAPLLAAEVPDDPLAHMSLSELEGVTKGCTRCRLHRGRTHVVFGVGNPEAELMFVGEAPGRDEDLQGEPFVGRAGQLLTRIIEAIGLRRQDVYIANVIKCRPPNNRNPQEDEIARCEPYLRRQIELVRPRIIVALGTFAAQTLLKTAQPISQLRGRFHTYHGVKLMPTFHPAFLLRNPERKRAVWEDMQLVQRELRQRAS